MSGSGLPILRATELIAVLGKTIGRGLLRKILRDVGISAEDLKQSL